MSDERINTERQNEGFSEQVSTRAERKIKAKKNKTPGIWFGLGMMGLIGWSIVVPTLLGAVVGAWLEKHHTGEHSWTLALLMAGLVIGCFNAWHWIDKEQQAIREEQEGNNE